MQFQVPQFIEVEDKIFGPLTFKQFVYVLGGVGASYIFWRYLPIYVAGPLILAVAGGAASLAFLQYNGRPFIVSVESAFYYLIHSKLYIWNNERREKKKLVQKGTASNAEKNELYMPKLSESRLHELAWSLDIKERIASGTNTEDERIGGVVAPIRTAREARL